MQHLFLVNNVHLSAPHWFCFGWLDLTCTRIGIHTSLWGNPFERVLAWSSQYEPDA